MAQRWDRLRPESRRAVSHAVRVSAAACTGFYLCLYLFDQPVIAVYAGFGAIAVGALAEVSGSARRRLTSYAIAAALGIPLITAGTLLAASNVAATVGMLVVGFAIGIAATGGGRMLGLANGLQLLYILPSFPPFVPDQLWQRIGGMLLGTALLALFDVMIRPSRPAPGYQQRLADAIEPVLAHLGAIGSCLADPSDASLTPTQDQRSAAQDAMTWTRSEFLPVSRRPSGPSPYDHAMRTAGIAIRQVESRIQGLDLLLQHPATLTRASPAVGLVVAAQQQLVLCREVLSAADDSHVGPQPERLPSPDDLDHALATFEQQRAELIGHLVVAAPLTEVQLRIGSVSGELIDSTMALVEATRVIAGAPATEESKVVTARFTPQRASTGRQWLHNLRLHSTLRSVVLQNAIRLSLGLAVARFIAGTFDLTHGFWVLLATLTVMRTTTAATRSALTPAVAGTFLGAVVTVLLLLALGQHIVVFIVVLPIALVVGFSAGALGRPLIGQAAFTLVVAALFTQVTPASWQIAEARLLDVLIGALVGLATGIVVWPRGGGGQLRSAVAAYLQAATEFAVESVRRVGDRALPAPTAALQAVQAAEALASTAHAQYLAERPSYASSSSDVMGSFVLARRVIVGARALRLDRIHAPGAAGANIPAAAALLDTMCAERATACDEISTWLRDRSRTPVVRLDDRHDEMIAWLDTFRGRTIPLPALDIVDVRSWLVGFGHDAERIVAERIVTEKSSGSDAGGVLGPGPTTGQRHQIG